MAYHHTQTEEFREEHFPDADGKGASIELEKKMSMADRVALFKKRTSKDETWD